MMAEHGRGRQHSASAASLWSVKHGNSTSKFASDLQRHLSFSKLETTGRKPSGSASSVRSATGPTPNRRRPRPMSATTRRSAPGSSSHSQPASTPGWGAHGQTKWVSKSGRNRDFTTSAARSLKARQIRDQGLQHAQTPRNPAPLPAASAAPFSSSVQRPPPVVTTAPSRSAQQSVQALPDNPGNVAATPAPVPVAGANGVRGTAGVGKAFTRLGGSRPVSPVKTPARSKTPMSPSAASRMSGSAVQGAKLLRERLMACMVDLQSASRGAGPQTSDDSDDSDDPSADAAASSGIPHLPLILKVLKHASRAARRLSQASPARDSAQAQLASAQRRIQELSDELNIAKRTAARRARDCRRVVVLDNMNGQAPPTEGAALQEMRDILRRVRADAQSVIDGKDKEIAKLKEVAQRTNDIRRLDAEIARIRANYDRRQRDIQESRARKDQAEVLLERVVAQTEQREQQLEEARVRATTVNTELATVTRKLHRQENKLAADLARAKAVSGAGKEAGDGDAAAAAAGKGKGKGKAKKGKVDVEALECQHRALVKDNAGMLAELTALRAQVERLTEDNERLSRERDIASNKQVSQDEEQQMGAEALRARLKEAESQVASRVEEAVAAAKEEWEQTHSEMARQSMTLATQAAVQKNELDSLRSKLRQAEGVTGRLRADLQRTTASLKDTQNSRNAARTSLKLVEDRLAAATQRLRVLEAAQADKEATINRAEKRNLDLESSVAQLRSSVNAQREEQVGRAEELAARLAAAADRTAAALREASEQRSQAEAASAGFAAARAQVDELRATLQQVEADRDAATSQVKSLQAEVERLREQEAAFERSQESSAARVLATQQQAASLSGELGKERAAKREVQAQLEQARREAQDSRSFVDSTADTLAALRRKLAQREEEIATLRAGAANGGAGSPAARSGAAWARKEGIKEGRQHAARQIKQLTSQLAELKAAYRLSTGVGTAPLSPALDLRGSVLAPPTDLSATASPGWGARRASVRSHLAATSPATLTPNRGAGSTAGGGGSGAHGTPGLAAEAGRLAKQKEFLAGWAADLAERDRDLSQRMQETNETLARLQKQTAASMAAIGGGGDSAQIAKEKAEVDAQKQLLRSASSVMKERLTLQLELLRITPMLTGSTKGVPRAKVMEAKRSAEKLQAKLELTMKRLSEIQARLAAVSDGKSLLDLTK